VRAAAELGVRHVLEVNAPLRDEAARYRTLPHPEVADYERRRSGDRDRWLRGMRRLQGRLNAGS